MKLDRNKIFSFMLAAAFALTLAGCGGGGGTAAAPDPEPTPMPEPSAQEMCEGDGGRYNADGSCTSAADLAEEMALSGAQSAASMAASAAMAAVAGAVDPVAASNAYGYASMAQAASEAADAATTSADAMGHQMAAEDARDKAMEAAMARGLGITNEANMITNQAAIDNAILEGQEAPKAVSNAGRVGTELATTAGEDNTKSDTPATTDTPPLAAVTNGSSHQGGAASVRATYNAAGPRFAVTLGTEAVLRGESPTSLTTSGEKPSGGWPGAELVRTDTTPVAAKTYVIAFSDINAPTVKNTYDTTPTHELTALQGHLANDPEISGDIPGDGSSFAASYNLDPDDNNPPVSGMFSCPTTDPVTRCSISVEDGVVVAIQGYTFQRLVSAGTTRTADADYLAWGVWLTVPDAAPDPDTAATNASAGAFASGNDVFQVNAALKGTATYNGDASGLYSAGGMVEYFDADVSLTANFGGTVGADSTPGSAADATDNDGLLQGAVTGTVSNIRAGGMAVDGMLTLKRAPVLSGTDPTSPSTTANDPSTIGFNGDVSGSLAGRAMVGNWGGQFYGPNKASGKGIETEYPTTAAGTFAAEAPGNVNDPIRILGAFGAWKAD